MIIGIGTDITQISRVRKALENKRFMLKYFTEKERELLKDNAVRAAGNFACKEAVAKALGTGFSGFGAIDIEVLRNEKGAPTVTLHGAAKELLNELKANAIHLSLSHCDDYAVATAIIEGFSRF